MSTKKITASVTLHRPAKGFTPMEFDSLGGRIKGDYKVETVAPGTPVDLDEDEADGLIAAGLAEEVKAPTKADKAPPPAA